MDADLPGDELLPEPDIIPTRAVTIHAPADSIWPWRVLDQVGPELPSVTVNSVP